MNGGALPSLTDLETNLGGLGSGWYEFANANEDTGPIARASEQSVASYFFFIRALSLESLS